MQLQTLIEHGSKLVLMDGTMKTNKYDWVLITIIVRDGQLKWQPAAQIIMSRENSHLYHRAYITLLKVAKRFSMRPTIQQI